MLLINKGLSNLVVDLRFKDKERDNNFFELAPVNEDAFATLDLVTTSSQTDNDFLAGSQFAAGDFVTPEFLGGLDLG